MTVTKAHIIDSLFNITELKRLEASRALETLLEIIKTSLESGEDVLISGFGKFCIKEKNPRRGRNPATGEDLTLGARRVITFKCSPVLREKMNGDGQLITKREYRYVKKTS